MDTQDCDALEIHLIEPLGLGSNFLELPEGDRPGAGHEKRDRDEGEDEAGANRETIAPIPHATQLEKRCSMHDRSILTP